MITRRKYFSKVKGVAVNDGNVEETEIVIDGRVRTESAALNKARKVNKDFLPMSAEYYGTSYHMSDDDFFDNAVEGDTVELGYPESDDNED